MLLPTLIFGLARGKVDPTDGAFANRSKPGSRISPKAKVWACALKHGGGLGSSSAIPAVA